MQSNSLKCLSFGLAGLLVVALIAATVLEKLHGTPFVVRWIYSSPVFVALWALFALCSMLYICRRRLFRNFFVFSLHASFLVILAGTFFTYAWGVQGHVHLRCGTKPVQEFSMFDGGTKEFPFKVSLVDFQLVYYPGTSSPMDYVSRLVVEEPDGSCREGEVSMNHVFSCHHYRFYQSKYDEDGNGVTLSVSCDPLGIAVTYAGYALLLCSMLAFFFWRNSAFRRLLHHPLLSKVAIVLGFALFPSCLYADSLPQVLPKQVAGAFGDLHVYYNGRICPLQTLARDFTVKLYGKPSYKGFTSEQVLTGWFFFYDDWKEEPVIRIREKEMRKLLGIKGAYARLVDFVGADGYKLKRSVRDESGSGMQRAWDAANEAFSLSCMAGTGSLWVIYPYRDQEDGQMAWYSLADRLSYSMPQDERVFVRKWMSYVAEKVMEKRYVEVVELVGKLRAYQQKTAGDVLPSASRFQAEKWYNRFNNDRLFAMFCLAVGLLAFVFCCFRMVAQRHLLRWMPRLLDVLLIFVFICLTAMIAFRGYASGHLPLSNGFETMQFMAWCSCLLALFLRKRFPTVRAFAFLVSGFALLVAMMGGSSPQITPLMPVLSSPLLSVHVMTIMLAYALFAFMMLNGVMAVVLHGLGGKSVQIARLQVVSRILLYPAVFLLAAGIFIGAVWANVSWGRYWGWDPKEVWALVTLLVYASALHVASLPCFRRPMFFHLFSIVAFLSVLFTYFGVNFLLGGMHSYA